MCLAVPGLIIERRDTEATVDFQGNRMNVSLVLTPEAQEGGWVLVHAGFAINELDEAEARLAWSYLDAINTGDQLPPTEDEVGAGHES